MKAWWRKRDVTARVSSRRALRCPRVLVTLASTDDGDSLTPRGSVGEFTAVTIGSPESSSEEDDEGEEGIEELAEDTSEGTAEKTSPSNHENSNGSAVIPEDSAFISGRRTSVEEEHGSRCSPLDPVQDTTEDGGGGRHSHGCPGSIEANSKKTDKRFRLDSFGKSLSRCAFYIGDNGADLENLVAVGERQSENCRVDLSPIENRPDHCFSGEPSPAIDPEKLVAEVSVQTEQVGDQRSPSTLEWSGHISRCGGSISLAEARAAFRSTFSKLTSPDIYEVGVDPSVEEGSVCNTVSSSGSGSLPIQSETREEINHVVNQLFNLKPSASEAEVRNSPAGDVSNQNRVCSDKDASKHVEGIQASMPTVKSTVKNASRRKSMESGSHPSGHGGKAGDSSSLTHKSTRKSLKLDIPPVQSKGDAVFSKTSPRTLDLLRIPEPQTAPPSARHSFLQSFLTPPTATPQELGGPNHDSRKFSFPILRRHSHTVKIHIWICK